MSVMHESDIDNVIARVRAQRKLPEPGVDDIINRVRERKGIPAPTANPAAAPPAPSLDVDSTIAKVRERRGIPEPVAAVAPAPTPAPVQATPAAIPAGPSALPQQPQVTSTLGEAPAPAPNFTLTKAPKQRPMLSKPIEAMTPEELRTEARRLNVDTGGTALSSRALMQAITSVADSPPLQPTPAQPMASAPPATVGEAISRTDAPASAPNMSMEQTLQVGEQLARNKYPEFDSADTAAKSNLVDLALASVGLNTTEDVVARQIQQSNAEQTGRGASAMTSAGTAIGKGFASLDPSQYIPGVRQYSPGAIARKGFDTLQESSTNPDYYWTNLLSGAFGSAVPFLATGPMAGTKGLVAMGVGMGAAEGAESAERAGASPGTAIARTAGGGALGAAEALPFARVFRRMAGNLPSSTVTRIFSKYAASPFIQGVAGAAEEMAQEIAQTTGESALDSILLGQEFNPPIGEAAAGGGAVGLVLNTIASAIGRGKLRAAQRQPQSQQPAQAATTPPAASQVQPAQPPTVAPVVRQGAVQSQQGIPNAIPQVPARDTNQGRVMAGSVDDAAPVQVVEAGVQPVVAKQGAPAGAQPGDVGVAPPAGQGEAQEPPVVPSVSSEQKVQIASFLQTQAIKASSKGDLTRLKQIRAEMEQVNADPQSKASVDEDIQRLESQADTPSPQYARIPEIKSVSEGNLLAAREGKKRAWKTVQNLRERIQREPLGGNRSGLRMELLKAENAHQEWLRMERDARRAIEQRAAELGKTTIRPKGESAKAPTIKQSLTVQPQPEPATIPPASPGPVAPTQPQLDAKGRTPEERAKLSTMAAQFRESGQTLPRRNATDVSAQPAQTDVAGKAVQSGKNLWEMTAKDFVSSESSPVQYEKVAEQDIKSKTITDLRSATESLKRAKAEGKPRAIASAERFVRSLEDKLERILTNKPNEIDKQNVASSALILREIAARKEHRAAVETAVREGKPVPREVLEDYKAETWAKEAMAKMETPNDESPSEPAKRQDAAVAPKGNPSGVAPAQDVEIAANDSEGRSPAAANMGGHSGDGGVAGELAGVLTSPTSEAATTPKPTPEQMREINAKGIAPLPDNHPLVIEAQRAIKEQESAKSAMLAKASKAERASYDPVSSALHSRRVPNAIKEAYKAARKKADRATSKVDDEAVRLSVEAWMRANSAPTSDLPARIEAARVANDRKALREIAKKMGVEVKPFDTVEVMAEKLAGKGEAKSPDELPPVPPPPGTKLPGGRQSGGTIMLNEAAEELAGILRRFGRAVRSGVPGAYRSAQKIFLKGTDFIERNGGSVGPKLADDIRTVDRKSAQRARAAEIEIRKSLAGLNKKQREDVAKFINGRESVKDLHPSLQKRAERIRTILDESLMNEARDLGMERLLPTGERIAIGGKGKAFPQVPNTKGREFLEDAERKGLSSPRVYAFADDLVKNGKAKNLQEALAKILKFREHQLRGVAPYLERTRFELPEEYVEWDPARILPGTLERGSIAIEAVRQWGKNLEQLDAMLTVMGSEVDLALAHKVGVFVKHELGVGGFVEQGESQAAGAISNYQTIVRLGGSLLSAMRNIGQRFTNTVDFGIGPVFSAVKDFPPIANQWMKGAREIKEAMERTGAVRAHNALATVEHGVPGEKLTNLALAPFSAAETGNQVTSALIASKAIERDIKRLIALEGPDGQTSKVVNTLLNLWGMGKESTTRRVLRTGISNAQLAEILESGRRLTPDEIATVANRVTLDTQFALTMATKPTWWGTSPWMRLMAKFKPFGVRQTGLIWNVVAKEAFKGNVAPLVRFIIATMLAGELYNIARDLLTGREESLTFSLKNRPDRRSAEGVAERLWNNIIDGGGVGMLADMTWGLSDFVFGPVGSSAENFAEAALHIRKRPGQTLTALRKLAREEIAISRQMPIFAHIDRAFFNENNRTLEYNIWRGRAFEFRDGKRGKTGVGAAIDKSIQGTPSYETTDRTLSYEYAARQITVGDVEDAADYLAVVLKDVEPREMSNTLKGIKLSMKSKSPLGAVAERDIPALLQPYSPEDRRAAMKLQRDWLRDYERAISKAMAKARRN